MINQRQELGKEGEDFAADYLQTTTTISGVSSPPKSQPPKNKAKLSLWNAM